MRRVLFLMSLALGLIASTALAQNKAAEAIENELALRDPFVRGLKRLDTLLRLRGEAEQKTQAQIERLRAEEAIARGGKNMPGFRDPNLPPPPISDPGFIDAFDPQRYRLDGLLISQAPMTPVIHLVASRETRDERILFWSGRERRWVYLRGEKEALADVARKFKMMQIDLLNLNGVSAPDELADNARLYVSPRDNGPLTHIVRAGETVQRLAKIYDMQVPQLTARNRTTDKGWFLIGQRVLVRDKTVTAQMAEGAVPTPSAFERAQAARPRKFYARIGQYKTETAARRAAAEIYVAFYDYMDSDLIIRHEPDPDQRGRRFFNIDIGPMRAQAHAEAYCAIFRNAEMACLAVQRLPGSERERNFESQAIVSVTPYVYYNDEDKEESGRADVERLKMVEYNLTEGQTLGSDDGVVAKITASEIFVIDKYGYMLSLPLAHIPEIDPEVQRAKKEAERQKDLQAAKDELNALADKVDVPELPEGTVVERLTDGESERRKGSSEAAEEIIDP